MACRNGYIFVCRTWVLVGCFVGFYCTCALRPSPANIDRASRMKTPTHTPRINPFGSTRAVLPTTSSYSLILSSANNVYGKNADIWPESNNDAIKLSDSFPNGIVPYTATAAIEQAKQESTHESRVEAESRGRDSEDNGKSLTAESGGHTKNYIKRILKRAASKEKRASENKSGSIGKIPIAIALSLLLRGMVRPIDVALVASWTAYFTILKMVAQSERDGGAPVLPTIPPQGHVPMILEHPLGMRFERSSTYRRWLKLGALVGVIGPLAWLLSVMLLPALRGVPGIELETSRVVARPLFIMSCQMITEVITKQNLVSARECSDFMIYQA